MALGDLVIRAFGRQSGDVRPGADPFGNLTVTQVLPPLAVLNAAGKLFAIEMGAGTAQAPKTAPVTTTAEWLLYNASPTDHVVLLGAATFLKSGTLGLGMSLQVASALGVQTAVTADYSGTIKTALNGSQVKPDVYLANNATLVGGTPAWVPVAATAHNSLATDSVGDGLINFDLGGMFIAPPGGGGIAVDTIGETGTTALFSICLVFAQVNLKI